MTSKTSDPEYRMPAEWEPHTATWLAWPHNGCDWPGKFATIQWVYAEIVRHLAHSESVLILVDDTPGAEDARRTLNKVGGMGRVELLKIPTDRVWTRDYGPMFVLDSEQRSVIVDWRFNAWAKYPDCHRDDRVAKAAARALALPRCVPLFEGQRVVLEGGSIDVNGHSVMLTTEECLLGEVQRRNRRMSRRAYEQVFDRYLGVGKVIWLGEGIVGDDTHGHVDDITRFVGPRAVVTAVEPDPSDPNHSRLEDNLRRLRLATDARGAPLEIITLPMPSPVCFDGRRIPASYANFYIANRVVIVPTFNDPKDRVALETLARVFHDRVVVGVHAVDLVWGLGTIHCLSQQQPLSRVSPSATTDTPTHEKP